MVSTFTPNIQLEEPARGDDVGTWDTPVNNNSTLLDLVAGAIATIGLSAGNFALSASQFRSENITFNSTLLSNTTVTFPTSFTKPYTIGNFCTGSSAFTITLATTVSSGQVIAVPPGQFCDVLNDGTNIKFKNLPHVGSYWDYCGSSTPNWNDACTVPPWKNCDGSAVSSATYPVYFTLFGGTVPNSKGRTRFALDQSAGNISSAVFSGSSVGATGGTQATTLSSLYLPKLVDPGHTHTLNSNAVSLVGAVGTGGGAFNNCPTTLAVQSINSATTGITYGSSSQLALTTTGPAYIGGLTLIRVA